MEQVIDVEPRHSRGKGAARRARAEGLIPGILYGHKERPQPFTVDPRLLRKQIKASGVGRNTVLRVKGLEREVLALLKDTQVDPVQRSLLHIDLIEVREADQVEVEIPIDVEGRSVGEIEGGLQQMLRRSVKVACPPLSIPKGITVDVTELEIGQTVHVSDLKIPEGATLVSGATLAIVTIAAPPAIEETPVDELEGEAVEGEEGTEPAEGEEGKEPAEAKK